MLRKPGRSGILWVRGKGLGKVDWAGVMIAAVAAGGIALLWFGPAFGRFRLRQANGRKLAARDKPEIAIAVSAGMMIVTATMMGHMFARVGPETLRAKPWLFFMMSGGLALTFVIPALVVSFLHVRIPKRQLAIDAGFWLFAYLAMGSVFFLLR